MSKAAPDFADVLERAIKRWYSSAEDFARVAGVSGSSVSRWLARKGVPTVKTLEALAPYLKIDAGRLTDITYPGTASGAAVEVPTEAPMHDLAVELDRMLAEDSPLTDEQRDTIERLVDSVVVPYRRLMRRRKTA